MKQLIIARKDLKMSPGKLAAQVSHASMAFISTAIRNRSTPVFNGTTLPASEIDDTTGERRPVLYRRTDLCVFAQQAFERGEDTFTVHPKHNARPYGELELCPNDTVGYTCTLSIDPDVYEQWFAGSFVKIICEARNRNQLMRAIEYAHEHGLNEGRDFFLIKDNCLTELQPEEVDENGIGRTLTCIGFKPLPDDIAHDISRHYQLFK